MLRAGDSFGEEILLGSEKERLGQMSYIVSCRGFAKASLSRVLYGTVDTCTAVCALVQRLFCDASGVTWTLQPLA